MEAADKGVPGPAQSPCLQVELEPIQCMVILDLILTKMVVWVTSPPYVQRVTGSSEVSFLIARGGRRSPQRRISHSRSCELRYVLCKFRGKPRSALPMASASVAPGASRCTETSFGSFPRRLLTSPALPVQPVRNSTAHTPPSAAQLASSG